MKTFAEAESRLEQVLPDYERRKSQGELALEIERAIAEGATLLAQAPTGTGKSLAYLVPAILSGKRAVVSTATKILQSQIAAKDLPFLQEHLGVKFTWAMLKGRSNYLCQSQLVADELDPDLRDACLQRTKEPDFDGEREHLKFDVTDAEWTKVTIAADDCPGKKECPFGEVCYAEEAKAKARRADVVVVNHALFFTDLMVRIKSDGWANMLDEYDFVVFDEAHQCEEYASGVLGSRITEKSLKDLVKQASTFGRELNDEGVLDAAADVGLSLEKFWETLPEEATRVGGQFLLDREEVLLPFIRHLEALTLAIGKVTMWSQDSKNKQARLFRRANNAHQAIVQFTIAPFEELVRWTEVIPAKGKWPARKIINTTPVNVGTVLGPYLFDVTPAILTSATLRGSGKKADFSFIASRLGVKEYRSLEVDSPFDFVQQARLYVPQHLPQPNHADWPDAACAEIVHLVNASSGRALVLCTAVGQMRKVGDALRKSVPYEVMVQGEGISNQELVDRFKADESSVLVATKSFFEGIDVQGSACSLVVLNRLPFDAPGDPVLDARSEAVEREGKSSFAHFTMPRMTLTLLQAFGRLIRHRNDRGVVAILDERLTSKGYGKQIMQALPPAPLVKTIGEVDGFFQ